MFIYLLVALQVFHSFSVHANLVGFNRFAVPSDFCDVRKGDTYLGIHSNPQSFMYKNGGSSVVYLPFKEYNHSTIKKNLIYRHLPKGGSSTVVTILEKYWIESWRKEERAQFEHARKFKLARVQNGASKLINDLRSKKGCVEFGVSREPLTRFISGYYHTGAYLTDQGRREHNNSMHGGYEQLKKFVNTLPDRISCEGCSGMVHVFPAYFTFCSCGSNLINKHRENLYNVSCMKSMRYLLRLEDLETDWNEFINIVVANQHLDEMHIAAKNKNKVLLKKNLNDDQKEGSQISTKTSLFSRFHIENSDSYEITSKLCLYLENDYDMLRNYYPLPEECKPILKW